MEKFTGAELEAAQTAITSAIRKIEKAQQTLSKKQPAPISQLTLATRRQNALQIASSLIASELEHKLPVIHEKEDLEAAAQVISSLIPQVENMKNKFEERTPQHTLTLRRIQAFQIALALIARESGS